MSSKSDSLNSAVVLINTLVAEPQNQDALLVVLKEGAEKIMPKHTGYLGSRLNDSPPLLIAYLSSDRLIQKLRLERKYA